MRILVTGAAGFIGFHLAKRLLERGDEVIGFDNLNDYYDPKLKQARLDQLQGLSGFSFVKLDLSDRSGVEELFRKSKLFAVTLFASLSQIIDSITQFVRSLYITSKMTMLPCS